MLWATSSVGIRGLSFLMPVLGTGNIENGSGHESLALHLYHFE